MIGNKKIRSQKGFTLMEILVVLALFSVMSLIIVDVFLLSLRSQRQVSARQKVLSNLRYTIETIARQVRVSEVDYGFNYDLDGDQGILGEEKELHLKDAEGNTFFYYFEEGQIKMALNGQVSTLTNLAEIQVINLSFFITPETNPFSEERCNDAIVPTGCQPAALACTVNDPSSSFKVGFCLCDSNDDCASLNCDFSAGSQPNQGFCLPFNQQPKVTLGFGFQAKEPRAEERATLYLQTTVSSRVYKR